MCLQDGPPLPPKPGKCNEHHQFVNTPPVPYVHPYTTNPYTTSTGGYFTGANTGTTYWAATTASTAGDSRWIYYP
jgi:hypothetical protein